MRRDSNNIGNITSNISGFDPHIANAQLLLGI